MSSRAAGRVRRHGSLIFIHAVAVTSDVVTLTQVRSRPSLTQGATGPNHSSLKRHLSGSGKQRQQRTDRDHHGGCNTHVKVLRWNRRTFPFPAPVRSDAPRMCAMHHHELAAARQKHMEINAIDIQGPASRPIMPAARDARPHVGPYAGQSAANGRAMQVSQTRATARTTRGSR